METMSPWLTCNRYITSKSIGKFNLHTIAPRFETPGVALSKGAVLHTSQPKPGPNFRNGKLFVIFWKIKLSTQRMNFYFFFRLNWTRKFFHFAQKRANSSMTWHPTHTLYCLLVKISEKKRKVFEQKYFYHFNLFHMIYLIELSRRCVERAKT